MTGRRHEVPVIIAAAIIASGACGRPPEPATRAARNLLLITVDTLRADHVGAYGYRRARTPALDGLARGVLFERAYAAAPITLTSHATLLTGRYPPGHGARDNGLHMSSTVPTLATVLQARGFKTAAFVAAFPLDHQFGLDRGFDVYGDRLPRDAAGRQANERPASAVVNDAIAWLSFLAALPGPPAPPDQRFFLWVHFFEPHAPYGDDTSRPVLDRYDDEIAACDREIGRLLNALGARLAETVIVAAGDHGEAFGEHGEYAHSIFVYDTTLRVPLLMRLPGDMSPRVVTDPVTLADVAPTVAKLLDVEMKDVDGIDLTNAFTGARLPSRELYAESFAPLLEFGWAPLRAIRSDRWKYIAAPKPELYDIEKDAGEQSNLVSTEETVARRLDDRANRYSPSGLPRTRVIDASGLDRLRALGYSMGPRHELNGGGGRTDPKDRREVAARIAQVTSGELSGDALQSALEDILRVDPSNSQAHMRLGYARLAKNDCARAEQEFTWAIDGGLPAADAHLGLATCLGRRNDLAGAARVLAEARRREPSNPIVIANIGILQATRGDNAAAIRSLQEALAADPNLHEARFNLALAYARLGRRADAIAAAEELLRRLPADAPQRGEVQRLLRSLQ
ncbi:MAG TPA: sulfatase-like hydrolase/transferase [Vicinamibacterales bacterium]|nr:sulfatase-like hydrolase/transferase [Vicinamibacterales bacterium]